MNRRSEERRVIARQPLIKRRLRGDFKSGMLVPRRIKPSSAQTKVTRAPVSGRAWAFIPVGAVHNWRHTMHDLEASWHQGSLRASHARRTASVLAREEARQKQMRAGTNTSITATLMRSLRYTTRRRSKGARKLRSFSRHQAVFSLSPQRFGYLLSKEESFSNSSTWLVFELGVHAR